jgi:hypothetical protein
VGSKTVIQSSKALNKRQDLTLLLLLLRPIFEIQTNHLTESTVIRHQEQGVKSFLLPGVGLSFFYGQIPTSFGMSVPG